MISDGTAARLQLVIRYMAQETPFVEQALLFSEHLVPLADKPIGDLSEEEAELLIEDGYAQLRKIIDEPEVA